MEVKKIKIKDVELGFIENSRVAIEVEDLKQSIQKTGLNNPVGVCLLEGNRYGLVYGFRRYNACVQLGFDEIDARVLESSTQSDLLIMNLQENVSRKNLNPMEEALAIQRIQQLGRDVEEFRKDLGWSKTIVSQRLALLDMSEPIICELKNDEISVNQARAINQAPEDSQPSLIEQAKKGATAKSLREQVDELLDEFVFQEDEDDCVVMDSDEEETVERLYVEYDEVDSDVLAGSISTMFDNLGSCLKNETSYLKFKVAMKAVDFTGMSNKDLNMLNKALERLVGPDGLNLWGGYES